jgi:hypothetical protein
MVNLSTKEQKVNIATSLPAGTYTDAVSGAVFKSAKGKLTGKLAAEGSAILTASK